MNRLLLAALFLAPFTATFAETATLPSHVATTPAERMKEGWWSARHEKCVEITKAGGVELAFLGDSITQGWEGKGKATWQKYYAARKPANFGFSGDRTEHVLWRLANGELVGLSPKVVVIMIGTNNIGHKSSTPEQTADGVRAIVATLREKLPTTKILLLGIFPRGPDSENPMRKGVVAATAGFKDVADGEWVHFLDLSGRFLNGDGVLPKEIMPDLLHLNEEGYAIWAEAMEPVLHKLLGE